MLVGVNIFRKKTCARNLPLSGSKVSSVGSSFVFYSLAYQRRSWLKTAICVGFGYWICQAIMVI